MKIRSQRVLTLSALLALVLTTPVLAGVVFEVETTDHTHGEPRLERTEASVEGKNIKIDIAPGESTRDSEAIYRGDRREMVVVDHDEKSYVVMDTEAMEAVAGQVSGAMAQIQQALENVPEDRRAMIEQMMKDKLPQQPAAPSGPRSELRKTSDRGEQAGYPCVKYEVLIEGRKVRELWVTDWSNIEGGDEAVDAFEDMAEFFQELMSSIPDFGQGPIGGHNAFEHMKDIGGFPVVTREFGEDGSLDSEATLRSARRRTLDPADFEPPAGYKRRQMFGG